MPVADPGRVDQADAPRRVLIVALEIGGVLAIGLPLVALTLPFLPPYGMPGVLLVVLTILGLSLWRSAKNLEGHARAGAELVVHVLAKESASGDTATFQVVQGLLPGLGTMVSIQVDPGSEADGKTLGDLNLRGRTGATVVALLRGSRRLVYPPASEHLLAGDHVALSGSHEAIDGAGALFRAGPPPEAGPAPPRSSRAPGPPDRGRDRG